MLCGQSSDQQLIDSGYFFLYSAVLPQMKLQETRPRLVKLSHSFSLTCTVIGYFITSLGLDLTEPREVLELVSYKLVVVVVALVIFHPSRTNSSSLMKHLRTSSS